MSLPTPSINVLNSTTTSITIGWSQVPGADSYHIQALLERPYRRPIPYPIPPVTGLQYTFSGLAAGTAFLVDVVAYAGSQIISNPSDQLGIHPDPGPNLNPDPGRSPAVSAATGFNGLWVLHRDGHISTPDGASFYGDPVSDWGTSKQWAAIAAWPSGHGYYCMAQDGTIFEAGLSILDISTGQSLGVPANLDSQFGAPPSYPIALPVNTNPPSTLSSGNVLAMALYEDQGTVSGYYVLTGWVAGSGPVTAILAFGAAPFTGIQFEGFHYDFPPYPNETSYSPDPIVNFWLIPNTGDFYFVTSNGYVSSIGNLPVFGQQVNDCKGIVPTPSGNGYWLVGGSGLVPFGDAGNPGATYPVPSGGVAAFVVQNNSAAGPRVQNWYLVGANDQFVKFQTP